MTAKAAAAPRGLRLAAAALLLASLALAALATPGEAQQGGGGGHPPPGGNSTALPGNGTKVVLGNQTSSPSNQTANDGGSTNQTDPQQTTGNQSSPPSGGSPAPSGNQSALPPSRTNGTATTNSTSGPDSSGTSGSPSSQDLGNGTDAAGANPPAEGDDGDGEGNATVAGEVLPPAGGEGSDESPEAGAGGEPGEDAPRVADARAQAFLPDVGGALAGTFAASTAAAVAVLLAAWSRPQRLLLLLPLLPLFSRIARERVLEHAARRHLLDLVEASPGIHYRELVRRAGRGHGAVEHHLRSLVRAGLLRVHVEGGRTRYFPPPARGELALEQRSALLADRARHVLACVARHGHLPLAGLARAAGLAPSSLHACVGRLKAARLVEPVRLGREVRVGLTEDGRRALGIATG